jgi:hypothetical protein
MREQHGMRKTRQYAIWCDMKNRCNNPNFVYFKSYGGRGIKVCPSWNKSFQAFWDDMSHDYSDNLTIDRINNDGDYEPGNCKWSTPEEQSWNKGLYKNNKLGIKGVQLRKSGKYRARIRYKGVLIILGQFDTVDEAITSRIEAEKRRYYGRDKKNTSR